MSATFRYDRPKNLAILKNPRLSVAVIIACRDGQSKLNLLLASLAVQNYPQRLISVYVVDDGSTKKLKLPAIKPTKSKLIYFKNNDQNWGKTQAVNHAIKSIKQDVIWSIDADMVLHPDHLAQMMKWHHQSQDYLVLGWKRFVAQWPYSPAELVRELNLGNFHTLHPSSEGKESWESLVTATNSLRSVSVESFRALVGATFSIYRKNWVTLGGYNPLFKTGEDTELGWRVLMAGMRMVPEERAYSWHLGISTVEQNTNTVITHNQPLFANYIPALTYLRNKSDLQWQVPDNEVLIDCQKMSFETFKQVINQFLTGGQSQFKLLGDWKQLNRRYNVINDGEKDLRAISRFILGDTRFALIAVTSQRVLSIHEILDFMHSSSTPYIYYVEGDPDQRIIYKALKRKLSKSKNGLEGLVDTFDQRAFIVYTPALNRARSTPGDCYQNLQNQWGICWAEVGSFDFTKQLSITNIFPMIALGLRSFTKIRRPKQVLRLIRRSFVVLRNSRSY